MDFRKEYLKITAPKISGKKTLQKISRTFKNNNKFKYQNKSIFLQI